MTPGTGINGRALYVDTQIVAVGSPESLIAAARLLGVTLDVCCITPSGRFDGHGAYVHAGRGPGMRMRCTFCKREIE